MKRILCWLIGHRYEPYWYANETGVLCGRCKVKQPILRTGA